MLNMIEYVIAHSPDDRILKKASELLRAGQLICFPTDTSWVFACSCDSKTAIEKLYKIKNEGKDKHFSLLSDDISKASEVAIIDKATGKVNSNTDITDDVLGWQDEKDIDKILAAVPQMNSEGILPESVTI